MYTVSITRLRVRRFWYLPLFLLHAARSSSQAQQAQGILGADTTAEAGNVFWTRTLWVDEAAMKKYRNSGSHQLAMRILSTICDEASYARWTQHSASLPSWEEAHRQMLLHGKLSKLKHPSPLHLAGQAAPPLAAQKMSANLSG